MPWGRGFSKPFPDCSRIEIIWVRFSDPKRSEPEPKERTHHMAKRAPSHPTRHNFGPKGLGKKATHRIRRRNGKVIARESREADRD